MSSPPSTAEASNHEWLVGRFADRLQQLCPGSILDVGCGSGLLLRTLSASKAKCQGLDQPGPRLEALRDEGLRVVEGSAYELPFADGEWEWVTMRHIPHHLEDPSRAFAEALRVASRGVLLAEPWFDLSLPSQVAALEYDRLEKALDRQAGRYHAESMLLSDLLEALPSRAIGSLHVESHTDLRLRSRDVEQDLSAIEERLEPLPAGDPLRTNFSAVAERARRDGMTYNGSVCVMWTKV